jgi:hypothetical protein
MVLNLYEWVHQNEWISRLSKFGTRCTSYGSLRGYQLANYQYNGAYNNSMKIRLHEIKNQVQVFVVLRLDNIEKSHYILMPIQLLQKHHFSERPLRIGCIVECIKYFLKCNYLQITTSQLLVSVFYLWLSTRYRRHLFPTFGLFRTYEIYEVRSLRSSLFLNGLLIII